MTTHCNDNIVPKRSTYLCTRHTVGCHHWGHSCAQDIECKNHTLTLNHLYHCHLHHQHHHHYHPQYHRHLQDTHTTPNRWRKKTFRKLWHWLLDMAGKKESPSFKSILALLKCFAENSSIHGRAIAYYSLKYYLSSSRSSVPAEEIMCHQVHLVDLGDPCPIWGDHLCKQRLHWLAGRAHHHKPEDHFKTSEWAWLSFGDHLQGRAEHASCERGFGEREGGMGRRKEGEERIVRRIWLLSTQIQQDMRTGFPLIWP